MADPAATVRDYLATHREAETRFLARAFAAQQQAFARCIGKNGGGDAGVCAVDLAGNV